MKNNILNIDYKKEILDNGLEVVLYKESSLPLVSVNLWYKVGSANEKPGKTGFAHLFEHMMFQGSQNIPKEMHFKYVQEAGGTLNGSTSLDRTNYYETLPSSSLELALWLESDRMGFLLPSLTEAKLKNQKDVVMNERRQRYDNQPYGLAWEKLLSNLFNHGHPYSWPTIGWMEDIEKFNLDDVKKFFQTYYVPNNASLVIAGDIEYSETFELVKKYFDDIPRGSEIPQIEFNNHQLKSNRIIEMEDDVHLPRIYIAWQSEKMYQSYDAALDVLSEILSESKNSRLYKTLLFDKQIAQDVSTFQYSAKQTGMFILIATAKPNVKLEELRSSIFSEINNIIAKGITDEEMMRAINGIKSSYIYSLQKQAVLADQLNNYNCNLGEPNSFIFDIERYESVTKDLVCDAAEKFLLQPNVELRITPKK
ncbi:MAG: pitrilysin family protein [Melioribacteraceae bacterium]|nr:pitrilysin family protein [Melioribacteraceae bacterium]